MSAAQGAASSAGRTSPLARLVMGIMEAPTAAQKAEAAAKAEQALSRGGPGLSPSEAEDVLLAVAMVARNDPGMATALASVFGRLLGQTRSLPTDRGPIRGPDCASVLFLIGDLSEGAASLDESQRDGLAAVQDWLVAAVLSLVAGGSSPRPGALLLEWLCDVVERSKAVLQGIPAEDRQRLHVLGLACRAAGACTGQQRRRILELVMLQAGRPHPNSEDTGREVLWLLIEFWLQCGRGWEAFRPLGTYLAGSGKALPGLLQRGGPELAVEAFRWAAQQPAVEASLLQALVSEVERCSPGRRAPASVRELHADMLSSAPLLGLESQL